MNPLETIKRQIFNDIPEHVFLATVKDIDEGKKTCTVLDAEGIERFDVKLSAKESHGDMLIYPAPNSEVLCGIINNNPVDCYIIQHSTIDKIEIFGAGYGGLIKWQDLKNDLMLIKTFCQTIKSLTVPVMEPGNGAPSAFQAALVSALSPLLLPDFNDSNIINDKFKHG